MRSAFGFRAIYLSAALLAAHAHPPALAAQDASGFTYSFRSTSEDGHDQVEGVAQVLGDRTRIDLRGKRGDRGSDYLLLTNNGRTVTLVDPDEKTYRTLEADSFAQLVSTAMGQVDRVMTLRLRDLHISTQRVGGADTIAGYPTERFRMRQRFTVGVGVLGFTQEMKQDVVTEFWVAPELALPRNPLIELLSTVETALAQHDRDFVRRSVEARRKLFSGTPLRIVVTSRTEEEDGSYEEDVRTIEITEIGSARVDPRIFSVPQGYTRKEGALDWEW